MAAMGTWLRQAEALVLRSPRGTVRVRFSAAKLHLVAAAAAQGIEVERPTLYTLLDSSDYAEHVLAFEADMPGLSLRSATSG